MNVKEQVINLQAIVKIINNNIGPNSLILTFFVFGTLLYLSFLTNNITLTVT